MREREHGMMLVKRLAVTMLDCRDDPFVLVALRDAQDEIERLSCELGKLQRAWDKEHGTKRSEDDYADAEWRSGR